MTFTVVRHYLQASMKYASILPAVLVLAAVSATVHAASITTPVTDPLTVATNGQAPGVSTDAAPEQTVKL